MKTMLVICLVSAALMFAGRTEAQTFFLADVTSNSLGVEGGATFGHGRVQPGFLIGAYHPFDLTRAAPDFEAYGLVSASLGHDWLFLGHVGAGATIGDGDVAWSARALLILTQTTPIAFRTSVFAMWSPATDSVFVQARVGPSIRLGQTGLRIFPYLAASVSAPNASHSVDAALSPGCALFLFL